MNNKEFNLEIVKEILHDVAEKNRFFVSEAHLQTEFIIRAAKLHPDFKYYPELVPGNVPDGYFKKYGNKGTHFDLFVKTKTQKVLVEFKYITNKYDENVDDVHFEVKSHMALNIRRYDCWKDIERIEMFSKSSQSVVDYGYFVLITNVPALWNKPGTDTYDAEFHIEAGLHKACKRDWRDGISGGTIKGRDKPIEIVNDYEFAYESFYKSKQKHGEFKFLVVEIN